MTDWPSIVDENRQRVWRTAYRLLGNDADAADCLQETFISALRLTRREVIRNWPALLQRLATTRALDRLRQRMRLYGCCETIGEWSAVSSSRPGPDHTAQASELCQRLRQALAQLPAKQAQAFCLRFLDDLSYREIAQHMQIKPEAVGVLLHRARSQLQQLLASELAGNRL
ncbi:MAG: hypothetical protein AMJ79_14640 [Phycisphaerae bacterium SM23_30]|nr:MAG: hypothetical protein AMJ79_14640 [Phycisphaerae bacterium SM23_30]